MLICVLIFIKLFVYGDLNLYNCICKFIFNNKNENKSKILKCIIFLD